MSSKNSVLIGAVAGAAAGLLGSFAMNQFQGIWSEKVKGNRRGHGAQSLKHAGPEMKHGEPEDPNTLLAARVSEAITGHKPSDEERERLGVFGHYALGGALGAMYGMLRSQFPAVAAGYGTLFATGVWAVVDEIGMPAAGLSKPPGEYPLWIHAYSLSSHLVYGATTDLALRGLAPRE